MVRPRFALLIGPLAAVVTASLLLAPPAAADDTSAEGAASTPPAAAQPSATIGDFRPVENADGILVPAEVVTMAPLQAQRDPVNTDCRSAKGSCLQLTRSTATRPSTGVRPAGGATNASEVPESCYGWASKTTNFKWKALSRKAGCFHGRYKNTVTNPKGEITGTAWVDIAFQTRARPSEAGWEVDVQFEVWNVTGVGAPRDVTLRTAPYKGIGQTGVTSWHKDTELNWSGQTYITRSGLAWKQIEPKVGGFWYFTQSNWRWINSKTQTIISANSRCDQYIRGFFGCVYHTYPGRMVYSTAGYPEFTRHVKAAVRSGLPGGVGTSTYLKRLGSMTLSKKNGRTACPTSLTKNRPVGTSCDEYPFRSTTQGAWTNGVHTARSFSWCHMPDPKRSGKKGYSRCFIDENDNSGAGTQLGIWYHNEHILNGDKFQVGFE